jgi:hypothetical protein
MPLLAKTVHPFARISKTRDETDLDETDLDTTRHHSKRYPKLIN